MTPTAPFATARRLWFAGGILLAVIDVAQTWHALTQPYGTFTEAMPAPAAILGAHGLVVMLTVGFLASVVIDSMLLVDPRRTAYRVALWGGAAAVIAGKAFVVASNFYQLTVPQ